MGHQIQQNLEQVKRRAYWQGHLECWQNSAKTATGYCKEHNLSIDSFKYWQYRLLPHTKTTRITKEFLEVTVTDSKGHNSIIQSNTEEPTILVETPLGFKVHLPRGLTQTELQLLFVSLRQASC